MTCTYAWRVPISNTGKSPACCIAHRMPTDYAGDLVAAACGKMVNPATAEPKRAVNRFCVKCRKAKENT